MSYPILFEPTEYRRTPALAGVAIAGITIVGSSTRITSPFNSLGKGKLSDAISCTVTEERNGIYELEMKYPVSGIHFEDIELRGFIVAKPNYYDYQQPFRIYKISKPLNGICTIYAQHISYDLSGYELPAGIEVSSASQAIETLNQHSGAFTITGQVTGSATFKTDVPSSVRSWFGGKQGSLIDLYGGEWRYDRYTCQLMANRGENRGVTVRYGKNLTTLTQEEACNNLYSHVRAYCSNSDGNTYTSDMVSTGLDITPSRVFFLDCSGDFQQEAPTVAQLNAKAASYITQNNLNTPTVNLTLDFVQMEGFDRVDLCDTVTVEFEKLGVSATAKCIKTVWNVLKDRYDAISLGSARSTLSGSISSISTQAAEAVVKKTSNELVEAVHRATEMITGNTGGYVVIHDSNGDGEPDEILIMDQPSIDDAVRIWRWNKQGLGYSSTGYDGTFGLAMTANGEIVADYITAGTMSASRIKGDTLTLGGSNNANGLIEVYDSSGNNIATLDRYGLAQAWPVAARYLVSGGNPQSISVQSGLSVTNSRIIFEIDDKQRSILAHYPVCFSDDNQIDNNYIPTYGSNPYSGSSQPSLCLSLNPRTGFDICCSNLTQSSAADYYYVLRVIDASGYSVVGSSTNEPMRPYFPRGLIVGGDYIDYSDALYLRIRKTDGTAATLNVGKVKSTDVQATSFNSELGTSTAVTAWALWTFKNNTTMNGTLTLASGSTYKALTAGNAKFNGTMTATGTKSRLMETSDYYDRLLYCYETPSPLFGDVGEGVIGEDGQCYVWLDPILAETISTEQYQVFLQKYGAGDCWIAERKAGYFLVQGTAGLAFGWELKAKQTDQTQKRLDRMMDIELEPQTDYGTLAADYLTELHEGRLSA